MTTVRRVVNVRRMNTMVAVVAAVVAGSGTSPPPPGVDHNEFVALFEATARALGYEVDEAACTVPADVSVTCYGQVGDDVHIALVGLTDHGPTVAVYSTPDAVMGGDAIPTGQDGTPPRHRS